MLSNLIKKINPPGMRKKNRGAIFRVIGKVYETIKQDFINALRQFFPSWSVGDKLKSHAQALNIPIFPGEDEKKLKERLSEPSGWIESQGMVQAVYEYLDGIIPGRYFLKEYPMMGFRIGFSRIGLKALGGGFRVIVIVSNLTNDEEKNIYNYLNATLAPDIEIFIIEKENNNE